MECRFLMNNVIFLRKTGYDGVSIIARSFVPIQLLLGEINREAALLNAMHMIGNSI